jgi:drug/metabolite transporter (DMT)-like permease
MLWLVFSLLSALSESLSGALSKRIVRNLSSYFVAWSLIAFSVPFLLPVILFTGIPTIASKFWIVLVIGSAIDITGTLFYVRAVEKGDLSVTIPLLSFTPLFLVLISPIINREIPTRTGFIGVILVVGGTYTLRLEDRKFGTFGPVKALFRDKGARHMFITTFLWSVNSSLHKEGISNSSPTFWPVAYYSWMALLFLPLVMWKVKNFRSVLVTSYKNVLPIGFFTALMALSLMAALSLNLVVYVGSVKNMSALFAVIIGSLFFNEKGITHRLLGAFLMCLGTIFISSS